MKARMGTARREGHSIEGRQRRKLGEDERTNTYTTRCAVCIQTYLFRYSMPGQYLLDIESMIDVYTHNIQCKHTVLNTHILHSIHTNIIVLNAHILYLIHIQYLYHNTSQHGDLWMV